MPGQGRGGKWNDHRVTLDGMLWVLRTGAPWRDLPERSGKWKSVSDRFSRWMRNVQIIVESHSEHFLRRLQRRVAEARVIDEKRAALYFCDVGTTGSDLRQLELDTYGSIKNWPEDFFGDEMADIAAMTQAAMKRRGVTEE